MGIPNTYVLQQRLIEINEDFKKKYNAPIQFKKKYPVSLTTLDKKNMPEKAAVLFEYFVLYNILLAYNPDEILELSLKHQQSGSTYLPLPATKYWKTVFKMGRGLKPSIIARKNNRIISFWFDKPLAYFRKGETASIRPDIVIRPGNFKIEENFSSDKFRLFNENEVVVECGVSNSSILPEESYEALEGLEWEGKRIYLKFKKEFIHPPLVIECKSFGAVLGNIQKYASYGKNVVVVSPEKLYNPEAKNIHIIRIGRQLRNSELREKIVPFFRLVN